MFWMHATSVLASTRGGKYARICSSVLSTYPHPAPQEIDVHSFWGSFPAATHLSPERDNLKNTPAGAWFWPSHSYVPASASDTPAADATEEATSVASMKAALFVIVLFILPRPVWAGHDLSPFMLHDNRTTFCALGHSDAASPYAHRLSKHNPRRQLCAYEYLVTNPKHPMNNMPLTANNIRNFAF